MLVHAKPFWALLLTAVVVCAYLPLEPDSVLPNQDEPRLVLPDRNAYDWNVTATYASGESHNHQRSDASNTMTVNNILDGSIEISVDLIGDSSSVWHSALGDVRVFIGLLKVQNGTSTTPMEADSGWLIRATQQQLGKPVNSTATATLEVESDDVKAGECYLVHISVGDAGASDSSATHPTFIFQPLFIEYDGGQCPLKDSDGDGYTDVQENLASSNPNSSSSVPNMTDSDGDGVPDLYDDANCTQSGWTSNASTDHDRDGCKDDDGEDNDDDNDGVPDTVDGCRFSPLFPPLSGSFPDVDGDGCVNTIEDYDSDGDGVCDLMDAIPDVCVKGPDVWPYDNRAANDTDGDGEADELFGVGPHSIALDSDIDGDGWLNGDEQSCNTDPKNGTSFPVDTDEDGICDHFDSDDDNDTRDDRFDAFPLDKDEWNDTDGDGIGDNSDDDADGDGWANEQEGWPTDVTSWLDPDMTPDTDGDTWTNVHENLTQSMLVNDHAWIEGYLPPGMVSTYIKGEWWNDSDITPDVAISLILTELEQSISTLNEIDDLQASMEALNMTLLTTLEGCLNTCPDVNLGNVTVVVADPDPGISDAGLVASGVVSGGVLTAAVMELVRRWRLNNNTGRMKTA